MKRLAINTALVLSTLAGLAIFWELRGAVLIFFLSLSTSAALRPAIQQLQRWGIPKSLALGLTYLGCVLGVIGLVLALVFPLASDVQQLAHDFKKAYQEITDLWPQGNKLEQAVAQRLPAWDDLQQTIWKSGSAAVAEVTAPPAEVENAAPAETSKSWMPRAVLTLVGVTWGFFGTIVNVLIIVVLSLYWSIDRVHFERLWLSLLDVRQRQRARETWRAIEHAAGAYLQREVVQSLVAGVMLGIGFWMFHQPYPVLAAAIGALAWLIPWIGAPLAMVLVAAIWLPSFILAGGQGLPVMLFAASTYTLLVLMLLEWLVEPRLFRRKRYNPILLVLVAVGMVDWLGVLGLLLAPPLAAAVQILGGQFLAHRAAPIVPETAKPQDLAQRLATLHARIADAEDMPEETKNLASRLATLVSQARELDDVATLNAER